ncbi:putative inorganic diphosphatase [Helianthus anomalus]
MAAARVMASTTLIGASSSVLFKAAVASPFFKPQSIKEEGLFETLDYRVFFVDDSGKKGYDDDNIYGLFQVSPWHDIPLHTVTILTGITDLLPQTWEDPSFANPEVDGAFGDNDPCKLDVVEIGEKRGNVGELMKIIAISLDDPKASLVNDVDEHFPVCYFFN